MGMVSPGVYRYEKIYEGLRYGTHSLIEYLPFTLTGILELSLADGEETIRPDEVVFLDLETTGLSRGTGTIPFVTGLAWFEDEKLHIEQYFLDDLSSEGDYLEAIANRTDRYKYIATYNGKAFDIPVLKNRLILNRKKAKEFVLHFDLLHILRRLVKPEIKISLRQIEMEKYLLGKLRESDIAGSEIPQIYFDYKKYGETGRLDEVITHNHLDMQGMMFLFLEAIRIYESRTHSSRDIRSGIAGLLHRNRRNTEAMEYLERLIDEDIHVEQLRYRDTLLLGVLFRREGEWQKALSIFGMLVDRFNCGYSRLSIVKILEHKLNDLNAALNLVNTMIDEVEHYEKKITNENIDCDRDTSRRNNNKPFPENYPVAESKEKLYKRRERIKRKLTAVT